MTRFSCGPGRACSVDLNDRPPAVLVTRSFGRAFSVFARFDSPDIHSHQRFAWPRDISLRRTNPFQVRNVIAKTMVLIKKTRMQHCLVFARPSGSASALSLPFSPDSCVKGLSADSPRFLFDSLESHARLIGGLHDLRLNA